VRLPLNIARVLIWLAACIFSLSVHAKEFQSQELAALKDRIASFSAAFETLDIKVITGVIPPKVKAYIRDQAKLTDAQLEEGMATVLKQTMEKVKIISFKIEPDKATSHDISNDRTYLLLPTETVMSITEGEKIVVKSQTLAMLEGDTWYLVRINDAQQRMILGEVYPEFKGVEFPDEQMETIKE
jgi:hypothetical protein